MPNFHSGTIQPQAPAQVSVGASSTTLVAANTDRVGLIVVNISSGTIYLGLNNAAVLGAGIALNANGGVWVMDEYSYTNDVINAIAHSANTAVSIQQFVR